MKNPDTYATMNPKGGAMKKGNLRKLCLAAMFLSLALVLPFLTGQMRELGNMLCLIHIPVFLCGFFCGPLYGGAVGFIAPLLRFLLFGMPSPVPMGISMSCELLCYGAVAGLLFGLLPKKKIYIYVSLICAMLAGRLVWGAARTVFYGLGKSEFGWAAFISGGFLNALPGIAIQIILIPILIITLEKYTYEKL